MTVPMSSLAKGWHNDPDNSRIQAAYNGTSLMNLSAGAVAVVGTLSATGALTVTAGGIVLTSGVLSVDDATTSTSAVTGSIHTDGGVGIAKNLFIGSTLENSDGVGTDGEQLTSGGAGAVTDWAAAGSLREFKHVQAERTDSKEILAQLVATPVYDFKYRSKDEAEPGEHIVSTGDVETTYTGIMADEAEWAMHHHGKILNPINTFGYTLLAIKALNDRLDELEA